jgi:hypothetical protein
VLLVGSIASGTEWVPAGTSHRARIRRSRTDPGTTCRLPTNSAKPFSSDSVWECCPNCSSLNYSRRQRQRLGASHASGNVVTRGIDLNALVGRRFVFAMWNASGSGSLGPTVIAADFGNNNGLFRAVARP